MEDDPALLAPAGDLSSGRHHDGHLANCPRECFDTDRSKLAAAVDAPFDPET
jgi:hypothetical protein